MPRVPVLQQQVSTAPLPGARLSPDAPAAAFQPPAPLELSGVAEIVQRERQKAEQIAVLDADNQLSEVGLQLQTDALKRRGKDALGATGAVAEQWQQRASAIELGLGSESAKLAFRQRAMARWGTLHETVERHAANEAEKYDEQTTNAALVNRLNDAITNYGDPTKVAGAIAEQRAILKDQARRNGAPPELLEENLATWTSRTHAAVIDRLLTNGQDLAAAKYYAGAKDQIVGTDAANIEKALEEGTSRGESQRRADAIVAEHTTRGDALAAVRAIDDPKLRDAVEDRVNRYFSEQKTVESEQRGALYLRATNLIDAKPGVSARDAVPPSVWTQLGLEQRNALENRARGGNVENDDRRWLGFLDLRPEQLGALTQAQFETQYWSHFDQAHRERAAEQWAAARDKVRNPKAANPQLSATLTFNDRVTNTLKTSGFLPANKTPAKYSKAEALTAAQFETEAAARVQEYELTTLGGKRKASGEEVQKILDDLVVKRVFIDKSFGRDPEKLASAVTADERGRAYVPLASVPAGEAEKIRNIMTSNGQRPTDAAVERAYAAALLGDRDYWNDIVGETAAALRRITERAPAPAHR